MNQPAATSSPLGSTASAVTRPSKPLPNVLHVPAAGSNAAMLFAAIGPANVKSPPITTSGGSGPAPSGSQVVAACTVPSTPATEPGSQLVLHCASAAGAIAATSPAACSDESTYEQ